MVLTAESGTFDPMEMARHLLRAASYLHRNPTVGTFTFEFDAELATALAKFLSEARRTQ
jgi:hypothetical protein